MADQASAELVWGDNDTPVSVVFDDPYYSRENGLAETRAVFLEGNNLPERFACAPCDPFHIAELGFGTGLNFLATSKLWQTSAPTIANLRFTSFEAYPMSATDMARALSAWPELAELSRPLLNAWSPASDQFELEMSGIRLTVHIGDARQTIEKLQSQQDAWYLDGFNPAKNADLWDADLLCQVCERTKAGGTFSTYTSAGWVRRNLTAAGFEVEKVKGFGHKRERLQGFKP